MRLESSFHGYAAAFENIQHHVLIQRLNSDLVLWIRQFLCDRPQRVSLNASMLVKPVLSDEIVVNTGAPQGCVLSPVFFSLYTKDVRCHDPIITLLKYADDMALVVCLKNEFFISQYFLQIDVLNTMLKDSFLELNVGKTKELVLGNSREREARRSVVIDQREVEMVDSFKYLGSIIDKKL